MNGKRWPKGKNETEPRGLGREQPWFETSTGETRPALSRPPERHSAVREVCFLARAADSDQATIGGPATRPRGAAWAPTGHPDATHCGENDLTRRVRRLAMAMRLRRMDQPTKAVWEITRRLFIVAEKGKEALTW